MLIWFVDKQVCRVLRGYYLSALELSKSGDSAFKSDDAPFLIKAPRMHLRDARLRIEEALGNCLLPSLQMIPANPAVGQEIWDVLNLLPYEVVIQKVVYYLLMICKISFYKPWLTAYSGAIPLIWWMGKGWWGHSNGFVRKADGKGTFPNPKNEIAVAVSQVLIQRSLYSTVGY